MSLRPKPWKAFGQPGKSVSVEAAARQTVAIPRSAVNETFFAFISFLESYRGYVIP